jgi:hypothetical protein
MAVKLPEYGPFRTCLLTAAKGWRCKVFPDGQLFYTRSFEKNHAICNLHY